MPKIKGISNVLWNIFRDHDASVRHFLWRLINIKMAQCVTAAAQTLSLKNTSTFSIDNAEADVVLEQSLFMLGQTLEWDMRWQ